MSTTNQHPTDDLGQSVLAQANLLVQNFLVTIASDNNFASILNLAFGEDIDAERAETLRQQWQNNAFDHLPEIELRSATEINGAKGAFSADTGKIYLSKQYLAQNSDNPAAIANTLLEEIGHFVDAQINKTDAIGDEGAIFANLVQGNILDDAALQRLKAEDDTALVTLDSQQIEIEQANNQVTLSGILRWTDSQRKSHAIRESTVQIWDKESTGEDQLVKTVTTDKFGNYTATFDNDDGFLRGGRDIYIKVLADGPHHFVEGIGTQAKTRFSYTSKVIDDIPDGPRTFAVTIPETASAAQAFSVSDAIYVGSQFAKTVRGTPPVVAVNYGGTQGSAFVLDDRSIEIETPDGLDWDVILHEYGHFLSEEDQLDKSPHGNHSSGTSNIDQGYSKAAAIRLAWGEGLATYLSIAAQQETKAMGLLPSLLNTGDTNYSDTIEQTLSYSVETEDSRRSRVEADELSISRILLDLADGIQDVFRSGHRDEVSYGHQGLYSLLKSVRNVETLDDLWNHFHKSSLSDRNLADIGAIFEEYHVSPSPFSMSGISFTTAETENPPPLFIWQRGNNLANDQFQVIIFDHSFKRVAISPVLKNVVSWRMDADQWAALRSQPGDYHYVVTGSDTDNGPKTGDYWSGARKFSILPVQEPLPPDVIPEWTPDRDPGWSPDPNPWGPGWTPTYPLPGEDGPPIGGHDDPEDNDRPPVGLDWTPERWQQPNPPTDSQNNQNDPLTGEGVWVPSDNLASPTNKPSTDIISTDSIALGEDTWVSSGNLITPQTSMATDILSTEPISLGADAPLSDAVSVGTAFPFNGPDPLISNPTIQGSLPPINSLGG